MKIVLVSIDGFGIGQMDDTNVLANTWKTIEKNIDNNDLPFMRKMISESFKVSLDYIGADSYLGHLTMSGIKTKKLSLQPLSFYSDLILYCLEENGYKYNYDNGVVVVENKFVIYDNFEADHGLAINIGGCLETFSFKEQLIISQKIRNIIKSSRLISFSASKITIDNYLDNIVSENGFTGVLTPKTGVYNDSFIVRHYPAITSFKNSMQNILANHGYVVKQYGKFANIINIENNANVKSISAVSPKDIMEKVLNDGSERILHCVNIQQTDLAGHEGNIPKYISILKDIDNYLYKLSKREDIKLIITSDHGNDPSIKDGKHTREFVPLWMNFKYQLNNKVKLSDISKIVLSLTGNL